MDDAEDEHSRPLPATRVDRSFLNGGPWPPSIKRWRGNLDGEWALKLRFWVWVQEQSLPHEARESRQRMCQSLVDIVGRGFIELSGANRIALLLGLYNVARRSAPPRRDGRPRGSRNFEPKYFDEVRAVARGVVSGWRGSFDRAWARNTRRKLGQLERLIPDEDRQRIQRGRDALTDAYVSVFRTLDDTARAALAVALYDAAGALAPLDRGGRPRGSRGHDLGHLADLIALVRALEPAVGRRAAVKAALANEPRGDWPALRKFLGRNLPKI